MQTDSSLIFAGSQWETPLLWLAAAALAIEAIALGARALRRYPPGLAAGVVIGALAIGPVLAGALLLRRAMHGAGTGPRRLPLLATVLHGTAIAVGAALLVLLPPSEASAWPAGATAVLAGCGIAWCIRAYRRTTSPLSPLTKAGLLALRFAVVLLLACILARPVLNRRFMDEVRGTVVMAIDLSASMKRTDEVSPAGFWDGSATPARISRQQAVQAALARHETALDRLGRQADIVTVGFTDQPRLLAAAGISPADLLLPVPDGQATAIGDSLQKAFDQFVREGREVTAAMVVSDGSNNVSRRITPEALAALLAARDVPLHAVGVGSPEVTEATKTVSLSDLTVQEQVEAFHRLPIAATLEVMGLVGRKVKVTCRFGDKEVASELIDIDEARQRQSFRWVHVPLGNGFHRVEVTAELLGPRPSGLGGQQSVSQLVQVVNRELRLLYVEGKIRYEIKFIKNALLAADRFTVDSRVLLQPAGGDGDADLALSENIDDWLVYHAIVLGDVPPSRFTDKQLELIRKLVSQYGKGFCMIGGQNSFGAGNWQNTPLADVLPVTPAASRGQIDTPVEAVPTDAGANSDVMRIGKGEDVRAAWKQLPALAGANRLGGLKPAAEVLAETRDGKPLIAIQPYGQGRSMAIAFDTTYRWVLTPRDTAELQKRFWRQVALFLCAPKGNAWITTDRPLYDLRDLRASQGGVEVTAGLENPQGRPLLDAPAGVSLTDPNGRTVPLKLRADPQRALRRTTIAPARLTRPGTYKLAISGEVAGRTLSADHQFEIINPDLEARDVLADFGLLNRVAQASGGVFVPLNELGDLLDAVQLQSRPRPRPRVEALDYAARYRWWLLGVLVALLCAEWAFRKKKGLV